jgi:multiple sugar transport system permease protein
VTPTATSEGSREGMPVSTVTSDTPVAPAAGAPGPLPPVARRRRRRRVPLAAYALIGPAMLYLVIFMLIPLYRGVQLSFTDTRLINPRGGSFVGLENYLFLLESERFWNSMRVTVVYTVAVVIGSLLLGTLTAVLINRSFRGRGLIRAVLLFPYATPTVAAALIFIWIYNRSGGVLNRARGGLGLEAVGWLEDPRYGLFSVTFATVWKVFPFVMLVMLSALQSVPDELYEATRVDGADGPSTFRAIVLPHLMPTIRVVALLMTIWSIRRFEIIWILTGGGPVERTNTLVINIYQQAFSQQRLGVAAAIGMLGVLLSLVVTIFFFFVERRASAREQGA